MPCAMRCGLGLEGQGFMGACGELWIERVLFGRLDLYSIQFGKRLLWDGWNVRRPRDAEMYHGGGTERPIGRRGEGTSMWTGECGPAHFISSSSCR